MAEEAAQVQGMNEEGATARDFQELMIRIKMPLVYQEIELQLTTIVKKIKARLGEENICKKIGEVRWGGKRLGEESVQLEVK